MITEQVNSKNSRVRVSGLDAKKAATFSNYSIQMEPTLALRHADRCFAIVHGCATAMNNAKVAEWACPIKQISCFYVALLNKCRCFSQFIAVASHLKRPQPCTMPTLSNVCSLSTKSFRLICAKQRINQALRRECLVRICVRISVGKCILSWINIAGAHFKLCMEPSFKEGTPDTRTNKFLIRRMQQSSPTTASRWNRLSRGGMQIVVLPLFMAVASLLMRPQPRAMPN